MNKRTADAVVLIPGYWLGGWAWEAVTGVLSTAGLEVAAVTLPGLESAETERRGIGLSDHIMAVANIVKHAGRPCVLVAHSGAGTVVSGVIDTMPERVSRVLYVDSGPSSDGTSARPDLEPGTVEIPLPSWEQLRQTGVSLEGLDSTMLERFRRNAVPHPAGPARDVLTLTNPDRYAVPATLICSSFPSAQVRQFAGSGHPMFAEITKYDDVTYVDLPTGHWPMWSLPADLTRAILGSIS